MKKLHIHPRIFFCHNVIMISLLRLRQFSLWFRYKKVQIVSSGFSSKSCVTSVNISNFKFELRFWICQKISSIRKSHWSTYRVLVCEFHLKLFEEFHMACPIQEINILQHLSGNGIDANCYLGNNFSKRIQQFWNYDSDFIENFFIQNDTQIFVWNC